MIQEIKNRETSAPKSRSKSITVNSSKSFVEFLDSCQKSDANSQYRLFLEFYENSENINIDFMYLKEFFNISLNECPSDQEVWKIQKKLNSRRFSNNQKTSWSLEEKKVMVWVIGKYCQQLHKNPRFLTDDDFNRISKYLFRRSPENIKLKWQSLQKTSLITQPFTQDEDQLLQRLYEKFKNEENKWKIISREMNNENIVYRTGKQLRERWINYLDPQLLKINDPWADREDLELINQIQQKGRKWTEIAKQLKRNENQVKNRFNCLLKREDIEDDLNKLIDKILWRISKQPSESQDEHGQRVQSTNNLTTNMHLIIGNMDKLSLEDLQQLTPCLVNIKTNAIYFPQIPQMQEILQFQSQFIKDDFDRVKREFEIFDFIPYNLNSSFSMIIEEQESSKTPHYVSSFQDMPNFELSHYQSQFEKVFFYPYTPYIQNVKKNYFKHKTEKMLPRIADDQLQAKSLPQILAF